MRGLGLALGLRAMAGGAPHGRHAHLGEVFPDAELEKARKRAVAPAPKPPRKHREPAAGGARTAGELPAGPA